jgi:predicted HAD superfamily Cof-like phosphohydrolase
MQKQIQQVLDFHQAMEQNIQTGKPCFPAIDRVHLRSALIKEECKELTDALFDGDSLENVADAICDSIYVILGTAIEFGLHTKLVEMFDEVQRSNMSKLDHNGKAIKREDGKVIKSSLFTPPSLMPIIESMPSQL